MERGTEAQNRIVEENHGNSQLKLLKADTELSKAEAFELSFQKH